MKLTREILTKLGFENKGKIWTKWKLDLHEDEPHYFSFDEGRIYFDVETVEELHTFWKVIKAEDEMPLPLNAL
jgi:virulence-associated protein VapD